MAWRGGRGRRVHGALVLGLYAAKVVRGRRSARDRHAGLIQAWIEYGSRIRTGQGQEQPSDHRYDDRSDFHDALPPSANGPMGWLTMVITSGSVNAAPRKTAIRGHYVRPSASQRRLI